jgi:hypothetical protein
MTRWDWKSVLGYIPLATSLYTAKELRKRAEYVGPSPYGVFLKEVARRVEDGTMTPWEAQQFVHEQQRKMGIR